VTGPTYVSDEIGTNADALYLELNGDRITTAIGWEHTEGILSQPCTWSMTLGWGDVAKGLIQKYPKGSKFALFVGSVQQASGRLDAPSADQPPGGATTVTMSGRDALAKLQDTYVKAETSVNVATYADLAWYALQQCGIAPMGTAFDPNNQTILKTDNSANRQFKSGVPVVAILPHRTVQEILDDTGLPPNTGTVLAVPQAKIGETWHRFLRRYIDRAGLMIWAAADGTFVLAAPNGNQQPSYQLVRRTGDPNSGANVVGMSWRDDATHRHTEAIIYGRGGGRVLGRVKAKGSYTDQEMIDAGYGDQPIVFRDVNVHSSAEGAYFARRKLAEERRGGYKLEYTISGCTLPFDNAGTTRAVVIPDTVVAVNDQELGIEGNFYVETVTRRRNPATTTRLRLVRIDDLVFGGPEGD
jgi:prophage tail gpP-like protein